MQTRHAQLFVHAHMGGVNEHYKELVKGQVDDMMASVLNALVSNKSGWNMESNIGKWLLEADVDGFLKFV